MSSIRRAAKFLADLPGSSGAPVTDVGSYPDKDSEHQRVGNVEIPYEWGKLLEPGSWCNLEEQQH
jgi:hypothetical protein